MKNLLKVLGWATPAEYDEGLRWYNEAHDEVRSLPTPLDVGASVVSILSPSTSWERTLDDARRLISDSTSSVTTYGTNRKKALRVLEGDLAPSEAFGRRAHKTKAFFRLLRDPSDPSVVIDAHMVNIIRGRHTKWKKQKRLTKTEYARMEEMVRAAARRVALRPSQLQAITWTTWRNLPVKERRI